MLSWEITMSLGMAMSRQAEAIALIVNDGHGETGIRINMNSSGMQQMIG